jgi:hypothetical protein
MLYPDRTFRIPKFQHFCHKSTQKSQKSKNF